MIGTIEAISDGQTYDSAMDEVAAKEFGITLKGPASFMGNPGWDAAQVLSSSGEETQLGSQMWEYYKSATNVPGQVMKAWLRWNGEQYDAYLCAAQDESGYSGFASHPMPYLDPP